MGPIVVGSDGSPGAMRALHRAGELAKNGGTMVHVVTAVHDPALREPIVSSARTDHVDIGGVAESVLARARHELEELGVAVETHTRQGDPTAAIIDVAREQDADMIVVGARGLTGLKRFLLGSVSTKVSHYADRTVMVVRDPADEHRPV